MKKVEFNDLTQREKAAVLAWAELIKTHDPIMGTFDDVDTEWKCTCTTEKITRFTYAQMFGMYNGLFMMAISKMKIINNVRSTDKRTIAMISNNADKYLRNLVNEVKTKISGLKDDLYLCKLNTVYGKCITPYLYSLPEKNDMALDTVKAVMDAGTDEEISVSMIADMIAWHILEEDYEKIFDCNIANLSTSLSERISKDATEIYKSLK